MLYRQGMRAHLDAQYKLAAARRRAAFAPTTDGRTLPNMVRPITERAKGPRDL